jgi:hypothetical protein
MSGTVFPAARFVAGPSQRSTRTGMHTMLRQHWLDYDPVALAILVFGLAIVELLALSI